MSGWILTRDNTAIPLVARDTLTTLPRYESTVARLVQTFPAKVAGKVGPFANTMYNNFSGTFNTLEAKEN
jgi:hypothetical protein